MVGIPSADAYDNMVMRTRGRTLCSGAYPGYDPDKGQVHEKVSLVKKKKKKQHSQYTRCKVAPYCMYSRVLDHSVVSQAQASVLNTEVISTIRSLRLLICLLETIP
jgi:hypothetical protein